MYSSISECAHVGNHISDATLPLDGQGYYSDSCTSTSVNVSLPSEEQDYQSEAYNNIQTCCPDDSGMFQLHDQRGCSSSRGSLSSIGTDVSMLGSMTFH